MSEQEPIQATAPAATEMTNTPPSTEQPALTGDLKTLKDAFPDLDVEIIEAILASQGGQVDAAFEVLLGMSDPTYKPTETQSEQQIRQDEEYARRLVREADAHLPQNTTQTENQPLFNFQEELPVIKEKVIEVGTAAKNKIMNLYNQFMAGPSEQQQQRGNLLETGIGNLSLSDNEYLGRQDRPRNNQSGSVDLYEWDGREEPTHAARKKSVTSTSAEQLLSDEEYAKRLAKEDADLAEAMAISAATPNLPETQGVHTTPEHVHKEPDHDEEVTFSAVGSDKKVNVEDDLDDLFDKNDSNLDLVEDEEKSKKK